MESACATSCSIGVFDALTRQQIQRFDQGGLIAPIQHIPDEFAPVGLQDCDAMNHRRESPQKYSMPLPEPHSEGLELRRRVRDLVTLSALPAMWKGYEPGQIADSAASALVSMLDAEFVYVGLTGKGDNEIDIVKTAEPVEATRLRKIAATVKLEIRDAGGRETITISEPFFRGASQLAVAPIGLETHGGRLQFKSNPEGGTIFHFHAPSISA